MSLRGTMGLFLAILAVAACPSPSTAQGSIVIDLPREDPFPAAPEISVHAVGFPASVQPVQVRLRLALNPTFGLVLLDSTIASTDGRFTLTRLLPENSDIHIEASVLGSTGQALNTQTLLAGRTGNRLTILSPIGRAGVVLPSRDQIFSWSSAGVSSPPGPWTYEVVFTNVALQETRRFPVGTATSVTIDSLQANTSYRWKVIAKLVNGSPLDTAVANSESSFVIAPSDALAATLLYQNFPNPFPAPSSGVTCIWFDLKRSSQVELSILDLRGNRVKRIIPIQAGAGLTAGRYGRALLGGGCELFWDGTSESGRPVPQGVYFVRLKTDHTPDLVKKIVYLGP